MDSFICNPDTITPHLLIVDGDEHKHLARVMRKRQGDDIMVTDGQGRMFECRVADIGRDRTFCEIVQVLHGFNEPPYPVALMLGVLKNPNRMDWLLEKAVELGVTEVLPVRTERCVAQSARVERLRKLARAATKQCLRSSVPEVFDVLDLDDALQASAGKLPLFFDEAEDEGNSLEQALAKGIPAAGLLLCVGPEGGFGEDERERVLRAGGVSASLGARRLRSETAALAALARLAALYALV
jgi:16S rRNA (uracil1498-N3)-methyltransferase